ncbi:MAG TPA: ATP-binding protein, partial [bacterium]|nr:ATP-binding protein [bacterium]
DVTETRRLEAELRHSQKMEAIGRLAGGVAHDFNNLLAVIQGQSELLISRFPPQDPARGTVESVRKAAVRGSLLTRQLLAFSRKDLLHREIVDVRDVVAGIEAMLRSLVGAHVRLHLQLDGRTCRVDADKSQLEQVIMNLAVNARDAMPRGGNLWISVARTDRIADEAPGESSPRAVRVEVRDDGVGMDERTRARLFEPFFTTKEQGRGTGLGLSSSYGIVQDFDGTIEVESSRGSGTRFVIDLPRVVAEKSSGVTEVNIRTDFERGTETILVVEDEDDVRDMAVEVLEMMGYHVLQAPSGRDALDRIRADDKIDLLLTDVIMPGMGGGDLVREALPLRPDLKVIYMSGYTADDAVVRHDVAHAEAAYIQKPFSLDGLSRKVREVLGAVES